MRHARAVDAAGRDVRGDHDAVAAGAEAVQGLLATVLGQVPLQRCGRHALLVQLPGQALGAVLGPGEDEHAVVVLRTEIGFEQGHLLGRLDGVDAVADLFRRGRVGHLHHGGLHQDLVGDLADLGGHGGGKQQILALGRQLGHDAAQIGQEAHVEHAVGLVQNQCVHVGQVDETAVQQVEQASRTGHQDAGLGGRLDLGRLAHPAEDRGATDARLLAQGDERLVNLQGQFAGRGQNENAHRAALRDRSLDHALQQRQGEGRRLAGAGLGQAEDILAVEDRGDGLNLNGSGGNVAAVTDAGVQTPVERK
ncbi:hypothetical protein DSECCO2_434260 [anaerobic digester metagenome]